jgi:acylphosphatase
VDSDPNEIVRVHMWVKGLVQNVGFRAHVEYHALQIGVLGWVRNLGTDTVETVAEGTKTQIKEFIAMVKQGPRLSRVDKAHVEFEPLTGQLTGFDVKKSM